MHHQVQYNQREVKKNKDIRYRCRNRKPARFQALTIEVAINTARRETWEKKKEMVLPNTIESLVIIDIFYSPKQQRGPC